MKKRITRLASTLLLVVALGGAAASAAQAHEWTIGGETLTKLGLTSESVQGGTIGYFYFKTKLIETEVKWRCLPTFSEGTINQGGKGKIQIGFSSCVIESGTEPTCVLTPMVNPALRTELVESAGNLYVKFLPPEKVGERPAESLFGWTFHGTTCAFNSKWYFQGSFAAMNSPAGSAAKHTFEISPGANVNAGAHIHFGLEEAELTGSYANTLNGKNAGKTWGGI